MRKFVVFRSWVMKIDSQKAGEVPHNFELLKNFFPLINSKSLRKKFLNRRTSIMEKITIRNPRKWRFSESKSRLDQNWRRNFCGEGCRNFCHFGRILQHSKFIDTKFWMFLIFICGVTNLWKLIKSTQIWFLRQNHELVF